MPNLTLGSLFDGSGGFPLAKAVKQVILRFYLGRDVEIDFIYEKSTIKDVYIFDGALVAGLFRFYLVV